MELVKKIVVILTIAIFSCSQNPENMIPFLEGYWEISEVRKDGKEVKEFRINTSVDYFEVADNQSGFRKKVLPTVDGKYIVTQHQTSFVIKIEDNNLQIHYSDNDVNYKETIVKVNKNTLIIKNDDGFVYTYKPFTLLDIDL